MGRVSFAHARISGQLDCRGAAIDNRTDDGQGIALDAGWAEIGHGVLPAGLETAGSGEGFTVNGRVSFAHARIAQS